jgi:hypothetical protein
MMKMEERRIRRAARATSDYAEHQFQSSLLKYKMVACCGLEEQEV